MIPEQKVIVHWSGKNIKHYIEKGYAYTKNHDELTVDVKDLPFNATQKIEVICDYCREKFFATYHNISRKVGIDGPHCCSKCRHKKAEETYMREHGVRSPSQNPDVKKKIAQTNTERYGAANVFASEHGKAKIRETNLKRYGVPCTLQALEVKAKANETMINKYGHEHALQNESIKNKALNKRAQTLGKNADVFTSQQQRYLKDLFHGEINVPCSRFLIDIVVESIAIEYDGGGHCLDLKLGKITLDEYKKKQFFRDKVIKSHGYKMLRIISKNDDLLDDKKLLKLLHFSKKFLSKTKHTWACWDINKKIFECAERTLSFDKIY